MNHVYAMVHSLGRKAPLSIISHKYSNNVIAEYTGIAATPFLTLIVGVFYVDDKHGKLHRSDQGTATPERQSIKKSSTKR